MKSDIVRVRLCQKIKRMFGSSMFLQVIVCMFGRPEFSTSARYRSDMLLFAEVQNLGFVQSSGR